MGAVSTHFVYTRTHYKHTAFFTNTQILYTKPSKTYTIINKHATHFSRTYKMHTHLRTQNTQAVYYTLT